MRKIYTESEREAVLQSVRPGERIADAARRLGLNPATVYLWRKRAMAARTPSEKQAFVELVAPSEAMLVRVGAATIEVRAGFDAALLNAVIAALGGAA